MVYQNIGINQLIHSVPRGDPTLGVSGQARSPDHSKAQRGRKGSPLRSDGAAHQVRKRTSAALGSPKTLGLEARRKMTRRPANAGSQTLIASLPQSWRSLRPSTLTSISVRPSTGCTRATATSRSRPWGGRRREGSASLSSAASWSGYRPPDRILENPLEQATLGPNRGSGDGAGHGAAEEGHHPSHLLGL